MKIEIFKIAQFVFLIFALTSCERKVYYSNQNQGMQFSDEFDNPRELKDFPEIANETNVEKLIQILDSANCIFTSRIGIVGSYSKEYACYERLAQVASKSELIKLTKNYNPNIRIYAYGALLKKHPTLAKKESHNLLNDTAKACYFSGCIMDEKSVKEIVETLETFPL